jgi:murein DD-endopeptidase MepM/ murein hydrolase activator NlpD
VASRRYSIVVADRTTGVVRRFTISARPTLIGCAVTLVLPVLIGLGAHWSAREAIAGLERETAALKMENASYRQATGQLASQISALQTAVDELGTRAAVDPVATRAMDKLPALVKSRAMGGGSPAGVIAPALGGAFGTPDTALGVLRDLLGVIERRLDMVRSGVERREALAAATPSIWPVTGWLSSSYGQRRDPFSGRADFHPGLDISADAGELILAPADGTVTSTGVNGNYGNLLELEHGFGINTRYGHLSGFAVEQGQRVRRGDVLGFVGSTGRSTSPHLHYEIWMNGVLTNPMKLLAR